MFEVESLLKGEFEISTLWNDLVTTHDVKDLATQWMYEVVIDSNVRSEVFLHAVTVFDYFLDLCIVQTDQVQLCASACLILASKIRNDVLKDEQIIDYTDNSITKTELKVSIMLKKNLDIGKLHGSATMRATQFSIKQAGRLAGHLAFLW